MSIGEGIAAGAVDFCTITGLFGGYRPGESVRACGRARTAASS